METRPTTAGRRRAHTSEGLHGLAGRAAAELERLKSTAHHRRPRSRTDRMLEQVRTLTRP